MDFEEVDEHLSIDEGRHSPSYLKHKKALDMLNIPTRDNNKLEEILNRIHKNRRLTTVWECANVMTVNRLKMPDHGQTHVAIVANAAIKILRNLVKAGHLPSSVKDYGLTSDDAEVIVLLAALFHDIGNAVHRDLHDHAGLIIAYPILESLLDGLYEDRNKQVILCEILHAMLAHDTRVSCNTLEAGCVRIADGLDMKEGRARIGFMLGGQDIHNISALSVSDVKITQSEQKPVHIEIDLSNSAGIFQIDNLLKKKIKGSGLEPFVSVIAKVQEGKEKRIIEQYKLDFD